MGRFISIDTFKNSYGLTYESARAFNKDQSAELLMLPSF